MLLQEFEGKLQNPGGIDAGDAKSSDLARLSNEVSVKKATEPFIRKATPQDESVSKERFKLLRRFHLGDPSAADNCECPNDEYLPALLHVYRHVRRLRYEYPLLLVDDATGENRFAIPLNEFLRGAVESFAPGESSARILKDNLSWLEWHLRERMTDRELPVTAGDLMTDAAQALKDHLGLSGSNLETLSQDLEHLLAAVPADSRFLAFTPNTAFHLLHHILTCHRSDARREFQKKLSEHVRGLKALLAVEKEKASTGDGNRVGLGARYLNSESFSGVVRHRPQGSVSMADDRRQRIADSLEVLEQFDDQDGDRVHLVIRPGCLKLDEGESFRVMESEEPCSRAMELFDELSATWARVFAAMRIARLEIDNKYDPEVHDSWFASFDWEAFSDNELHLVPTIVAVETTDHAAGDQMNAVSRVLNSGKPLQIAMTVSAHGNPEKTGDDPLRGFRMELAYFGIGHREAVVNQVSTARAGSLIDGFSSAFESTRPSLHLIHTGYTSPQPLHPWIMASAALESRAHPYIRFNPAFVDGGQIDFAENPSADEDWASNEITWRESDDVTVTRQLEFTFADYCLLKPGLRGHFGLVPEDLESEDLVSVGDYLRADRADQDRLIPFVWAIDAEGAVRKVIVSRVLMFACRDRSGFWRDLQSMAGIHNFYVDQAVAKAREEERSKAAAEVDELKQAHEEELEGVRANAAEDIMGRLTEVLLGLDLSDAALRGSSPAAAPQPSAQPEPTEKPAAEAEEVAAEPEVQEEPEEEISFDEPWIDSMLCTSCDDCMTINKTLFVYNDDKQAIISDPAKGTYEQLVRAAELCPAKCIHPGKPQNASEPNLDELMKRAEPFN